MSEQRWVIFPYEDTARDGAPKYELRAEGPMVLEDTPVVSEQENERLREALKKIAEMNHPQFGGEYAVEIANDALSDPEEERCSCGEPVVGGLHVFPPAPEAAPAGQDPKGD
jgi:hypothetical protein